LADYELPDDVCYSRDDEWIRKDGDVYLVGVTDYAQQQLGDVVFVELPEVGARFSAGDSFGVIESVKAVSDLYCPIGGEVIAINETLEDSPEFVNGDCYGDGWLITISPSNQGEIEALMDAAAYARHIAEREE